MISVMGYNHRMEQDWYAVLGVKRDASEKEIKAAYRELALIHHPDRNRHDPAAEKKFKRVQRAYEVLSDKHERAAHDRELNVHVKRPAAAGAPRWEPPPPPQPIEKHRGMTQGQAVVLVGAVLAVRGMLGVYVAPHAGPLENLLSLSYGENEGFIFLLAGIAIGIYGLSR